MRLLISGSLRNSNTIGTFIIKNFDASINYELLKFPDQFAELMNRRVYRLVYRIFPFFLIRKMDKLFLNQVLDYRPTIILIFKGMEISRWSLERISAMGIKLVNYNFDHPYEYFAKGTGNRFVKEAIPFYDLHISYSSFIAAELAKKFNVKTAWIPFAYHITDDQYKEVVALNSPEVERVAFVGNPDSHRIEIIKKLLNDRVPIDLFGFGWHNFLEPNEMLVIHSPRKPGSFWIDQLEFWKILRQYRVQLNFFRPHNERSHNLRTFEVPAVGGILLTPLSSEQAEFFSEGSEVFFYNDYASLLNQCRRLLSEKTELINKVRAKARSKSILMDYSYKRRTKDLLTLLSMV